MQRPADDAQTRPQAGRAVRSDQWRSASAPDQYAAPDPVFWIGGNQAVLHQNGRRKARCRIAGKISICPDACRWTYAPF